MGGEAGYGTGKNFQRMLPVGAEPLRDGGVHFRVWAPRCSHVAVVLEGGPGSGAFPKSFALERDGDGYFSGLVGEATAGSLYRYRLDESEQLLPDPVSRFQPHGPHLSSQVIDPRAFSWKDSAWAGLRTEGQVLYEMHVGTFTRQGDWRSAAAELPELAGLGITVIELMPVAEFPGRFGWGYDGVDFFAPSHLYGAPEDLRAFIDKAHAHGIGIILDVVYNHVGSEGNYLREFSPFYISRNHDSDWGASLNFDDQGCGPVREFVLSNVRHWIIEYHFDGFRVDATQQLFDDSQEHILNEITRDARQAAGERSILMVAENEPQESRLLYPADKGGAGLDALWNDDFHHSAMVALTGRNEAYFTDYLGRPQEFISTAKWGFLFQGQRYKWQCERRGTPAFGLRASCFINFIQNHDQVANSARGWRIDRLTSPGRYRAMTAFLLLGPATPMLFQGQEFAASTPFLYFCNPSPLFAKNTRRGRAEFLTQFISLATPEMQAMLSDPSDTKTFEQCILNLEERRSHSSVYDLHRDLLRLRHEDLVFKSQASGGIDGAVLGPQAFVLRYWGPEGDDRLLLVNLGMDLHLDPAPEPLLAPSAAGYWSIIWSSEHLRYGGNGVPEVEDELNWHIPGEAAIVLAPETSTGER